MGKIQDIERQVQALSSEELTQFRAWFLEFTGRRGTGRSNETFKQADSTLSLRRLCGTTQPARPRLFDAPMRPRISGHATRPCRRRSRSSVTAAYARLKQEPRHPSLHSKKAGRFWSAPLGGEYRAPAVETTDRLVSFWIGSHADYDKLLG